MSEVILALAVDYGVPLLFAVTLLSCLALPVPSSLLMIAMGGFAASEDFTLGVVVAAAFSGAIIGDNLGYWIARGLGERLGGWLSAHPKRAALRHKSEVYMQKYGGASVFFSCWLVAPLGPYVNYVSGLSRFSWPRFALWGMAGEVFWVGIYVGLGYVFADNITAIAELAGNLSGFLAAVVVAIGLGLWLLHHSKAREAARAAQATP